MILFDKVSVVYSEDAIALEDISFNIKEGEKVALVGANGAGKSSLLLSIVGAAPIKSGKVTVGGVELNDKNLNAIRDMCGFVFQNPDDQVFMPTVEADAAFTLRNRGAAEDIISGRLDAIFKKFGIAHLKLKFTHRLSGGEKRSVALAGALASEPRILILDEPCAFLDPAGRENIISILNSLPHTQLIATHDLDMALSVCTKVILLYKGKLVRTGTLEILSDQKLLESKGLRLPHKIIN